LKIKDGCGHHIEKIEKLLYLSIAFTNLHEILQDDAEWVP